MRGVDVKDGPDVAGRDKVLVVSLHLCSNTCIAEQYHVT